MLLNRKLFLLIFIIILSTGNGHSFLLSKSDKLVSSDNIKNYLYGSILFGQNKHNQAAKYFEKSSILKQEHFDYDFKYLTSLLLSGKLNEASEYAEQVKSEYQGIFIFDFVEVLKLIKEKKNEQALLKLNTIKPKDQLVNQMFELLKFWLKLENLTIEKKIDFINTFSTSYKNINLINKFLASSFVNEDKLIESSQDEILKNEKLTRYHVFIAWNYIKNNKISDAKKILEDSLKTNPNNLLLKQTFLDLEKKDSKILKFFNERSIDDNYAEIFYIFSNLFQQRNDVDFSQLLLSAALDFNHNFLSNKILYFENKMLEDSEYDFKEADIQKVKNIGSEYAWYIDYQLLIRDNKKDIKELKKYLSIKNTFLKNKIKIFADFYRSKKNYTLALSYYNQYEKIEEDLNWRFYFSKGACLERLKKWNEAEIYLKKSVELSPNEYTVINYLAYSWLERGEKIDEATSMLENAVKLSKWQLGYIIDSLGWAYFLKKDYEKAEKLLLMAYEKTSSESEVYDHYGDVLWKNKKFLQARYVWQNALKLETIDDERKLKIEGKLLNGLINEKN
jgi:tetratricopeptide (TPR) repeat protein